MFDIWPQRRTRILSDREALQRDWEAVGNDLRKAMGMTSMKHRFKNGDKVSTPKGDGTYIGWCPIEGHYTVRIGSKYENFDDIDLSLTTKRVKNPKGWLIFYLLILVAFWTVGILENYYAVPILVTVIPGGVLLLGGWMNRTGRWK